MIRNARRVLSAMKVCVIRESTSPLLGAAPRDVGASMEGSPSSFPRAAHHQGRISTLLWDHLVPEVPALCDPSAHIICNL